jgi:hypothetical protein
MVLKAEAQEVLVQVLALVREMVLVQVRVKVLAPVQEMV